MDLRDKETWLRRHGHIHYKLNAVVWRSHHDNKVYCGSNARYAEAMGMIYDDVRDDLFKVCNER